jgi:hypothetical protein
VENSEEPGRQDASRTPPPYRPPHQQPSQPPWQPSHPATPQPGPGLAVGSLLLAVFGLFFSWFTFGVPSLIAVVLGIIASRRANAAPGTRIMAVAGLVLGAIPVIIFVGFAVLLAAGALATS